MTLAPWEYDELVAELKEQIILANRSYLTLLEEIVEDLDDIEDKVFDTTVPLYRAIKKYDNMLNKSKRSQKK